MNWDAAEKTSGIFWDQRYEERNIYYYNGCQHKGTRVNWLISTSHAKLELGEGSEAGTLKTGRQ